MSFLSGWGRQHEPTDDEPDVIPPPPTIVDSTRKDNREPKTYEQLLSEFQEFMKQISTPSPRSK